MWLVGAVAKVEAALRPHSDYHVPHDTIGALTLRFCDEGIERGFIMHCRPRLIANVRRILAVTCMISTASLTVGRAWEQDRFPSVEENQTFKFMTTTVVCTVVAAVAMFAMTFFSEQIFGSNHLVPEVFVSMCCVLILVVHMFALPWYAARVLGFDPLELETLISEVGPATDTRMVLAIDLVVTCTHLLLPVRCFVLVLVEVGSVLCYVVPTWFLGGPEMENAPLTLLFLVSLIGMAACGKRNLEYQERTQFLSLIKEKSLRFQSEFELSQHVPQPGNRNCPSEEESRPSTTETSRAFMLGDSSVQDLIPVGEREQWLIRVEEMSFRWPPIGEGGYGKVFSGSYYGHPVAIKVPKTQTHPVGRTSMNQVLQLCNELRILRKLRHPNIVFFYGACIGEQQSQMALVLELVTGCSLRSFILCEHHGRHTPLGGTPEPPSEVERASLIVGISSAVRYLHSRNPCVVHGDLKCSNVFVELACCPLKLPAPKLLDFGLSRALTRNAKPLGGTLRWVAPEVLSGSSPSTAADVFSYGCLTSFICTSKHPGNAGRPPQRPSWPARGWLAQACEPSVEECCAEDASARPCIRKVSQQAEGWLEVLLAQGGPRAGADGRPATGPPAGAAAPGLSCPAGGVAGRAARELRLLFPEHRRTPAATVEGMLCDLLLSCNVEAPVQACCHFHAALSGLSRAIVKCVEGPCKPWNPRGAPCRQCPGCGLLVCRVPRDSGESLCCDFCDQVLSETWEPDSANSKSINSLPGIAEEEAIDEMHLVWQASDGTSTNVTL